LETVGENLANRHLVIDDQHVDGSAHGADCRF
jgi:hypothetical protein